MNVDVLKVARSCGTITVPGGQSKDGGCESTRLPIQVESHKTRPRAWPDWRRGGLSRLAAGLISSAACYLTHLLPSSRRAASLDKRTINVCRRPKVAGPGGRPPAARATARQLRRPTARQLRCRRRRSICAGFCGPGRPGRVAAAAGRTRTNEPAQPAPPGRSPARRRGGRQDEDQ